MLSYRRESMRRAFEYSSGMLLGHVYTTLANSDEAALAPAFLLLVWEGLPYPHETAHSFVLVVAEALANSYEGGSFLANSDERTGSFVLCRVI